MSGKPMLAGIWRSLVDAGVRCEVLLSFLKKELFYTWSWRQDTRRRANPVVEGYRQAVAIGCPCLLCLSLLLFVCSLFALFVPSVLFLLGCLICNLVWF